MKKLWSAAKRVGVLFLISLPTWALGLKPPIDFTSAKVLPKGVRNLRLRPIFSGANERFDNTGRIEPVGSAMNAPVSFNRLVEGKPALNERGTILGETEMSQLKSFLNTHGISDLSKLAGNTTGDVHVSASVITPIFAYGASKKWTWAAAVPIYQFQSQVKTGFIAGPELEKLAKTLVEKGMTKEYLDLVKNMDNPIVHKMQDYGYEPLANEKFSAIGDVKLVSKYLLIKGDLWSFTWQHDLTLPTGKKPSVNKLIDLSPGDGQWDVGTGFIGEVAGPKGLSVAATVGVEAELAQNMAKRIPEYPDSSLSPDIDPQTHRDLGDQIYSQIHGRFEFLEGLAVSSALGYQYKQKDRYSGNVFAAERYEWLEANTDQYLLSAQLGLGVNTISKFLRKAFIAPLEANLNYTYVLAGKNVSKDSLVALDFALFF